MLTIPRSSTFPDGKNSPDQSKPVRYHYTIELEGFGQYEFQLGSLDNIENMEGSLSFAQSFDYNEPPVAALAVTPERGGAPLLVTFDAGGSADNDGEVVLYEWDFDGDGTFDSNTSIPTTKHTFETPGTFEAVVQVTDDGGATDSASAEIEVFSTQPPVFVLTASTTEGNTPLFVRFEADVSETEGTPAASIEWDLDGDGAFGDWTGPDPVPAVVQYLYLEAGVTVVTVKCTNDSGAWDTASIEITANAVGPGLYIAPDPTDYDWLDVSGTGTEVDPFVVAKQDGYNADLQVEFGLVAYQYSEGIWSEVNVADLEWIAWPPFIVDWVSPGVFQANMFTGEYFYATSLAPEGVSNFIYVVSMVLPDG